MESTCVASSILRTGLGASVDIGGAFGWLVVMDAALTEDDIVLPRPPEHAVPGLTFLLEKADYVQEM